MSKNIYLCSTRSCIKCITVLYNLAYWVIGALIIALGIYLARSRHEYTAITQHLYYLPTLILISTGFSILSIGFLPILGLIWNNRIYLFTYSMTCMCLFALFLSSSSWGLSALTVPNVKLRNFSLKSLTDYTNCNFTKTHWDAIQTDFRCCGVSGPQDWQEYSSYPGYVPDSCCVSKVTGCGLIKNPSIVKVWKDGCIASIIEYEHEQLGIATGVSLVVAMVTLIGAIINCITALNISSRDANE